MSPGRDRVRTEGAPAPHYPLRGSCAIPGHSPSSFLRAVFFPWLILRSLLRTHNCPISSPRFLCPILISTHPVSPHPQAPALSPSSRVIGAVLPVAGAGGGEAGAHFAFSSGTGRQHQQGQGAGVPLPSTPASPSCVSLPSLGSCWCRDHAVRVLAAPAWGD